MNWFTNLPPAITKPLWALFLAVVAFVAAKYGITIPPAVNTTVVDAAPRIVLPGLDTTPLLNDEDFRLVEAPEALGAEREGLILKLARRAAGKEYARQHGLTNEQGIELAKAVPLAKVKAACETFGVDDNPVVRGPIMDWIKANPEKFQQLLKILLMLLPLLA